MKRLFTIGILALMMCLAGTVSSMAAPTKQQKRVAYTIKNLKLDANTAKALQPILVQYLNELKAASKPYEDLKTKYDNDIKKNLLTDKVAETLLKAKWQAAQKETEVKMKYEAKFRSLLSTKKVWYCFSLLNDKMSKIEGTKANSKDDDDD